MAYLSRVDVDQFYGIELGEFPARIAETALWIMDHIMNNRFSLEFGRLYRRIPLQKAPHVVHGDALEIDWSDVLPAKQCDYVLEQLAKLREMGSGNRNIRRARSVLLRAIPELGECRIKGACASDSPCVSPSGHFCPLAADGTSGCSEVGANKPNQSCRGRQQTHQLADRQRQDAEHEVAKHLRMTPAPEHDDRRTRP